MSRLLTLLLLYQSGYFVGKYISIEKILEQSQEAFYQAFRQSSYGWHENENDYVPFIRYILGVVLKAYKELFARTELLRKREYQNPTELRQ